MSKYQIKTGSPSFVKYKRAVQKLGRTPHRFNKEDLRLIQLRVYHLRKALTRMFSKGKKGGALPTSLKAAEEQLKKAEDTILTNKINKKTRITMNDLPVSAQIIEPVDSVEVKIPTEAPEEQEAPVEKKVAKLESLTPGIDREDLEIAHSVALGYVKGVYSDANEHPMFTTIRQAKAFKNSSVIPVLAIPNDNPKQEQMILCLRRDALA